MKRPSIAEGLFICAASRFSLRMPRRTDIEIALRRLVPGIPAHEFGAVVDHALDSGGLRTASPEAAAWLSLVAYVRHTFTDYDERLDQGYDRDSARFFVAGEINDVLKGWGAKRLITDED
jgi:hypothetical protein